MREGSARPIGKEAPPYWGGALVLIALIIALRGATLLFDHSLNSIDGALQTWFALDNFAQGNQLGSDFQSYLGVTMILALLPAYLAFGKTLFASTLAANALVTAGAFVSAYAIAWFFRGVQPRYRWLVAVLLVFGFYYAAGLAAGQISYPWPASLDPGVSLRPLRGLLPFLVLPSFVVLLRKAINGQATLAGLLLGFVAGAGLLWSNDAGLPLVIALAIGLVMALHPQRGLLAGMLGAFAIGTTLSAGAIILLVTHGEPGPWLHYNFRDVAGDQFWFFAPWDRSTRILGPADLPNIALKGNVLSVASLIVLTICVAIAMIQRLRQRGSPVRGAAFIFVGASLIGTALIPQIGGHVGSEYNTITFVFGLCAPLILAQKKLLRLAKPALRSAPAATPMLALGLAAIAMPGVEAGRLIATASATDRTVRSEALGFFVTQDFSEDLQVMERLTGHWDGQGIANDRRLLSVYTSPLDIAARTQSPAPVGSLIHALGAAPRAQFTSLVAERSVAAVTTIAPDYSGWEGWIARANWPFFRHLHENYTPIGRNAQHILWVRADSTALPAGPATCRIIKSARNTLAIEIEASAAGLASVEVSRHGPFATGRGAMLTVTETSPDTASTNAERWADFPRYGIGNTPQLSLVAPIATGRKTSLRLEIVDGSAIGSASCTAQIYAPVDYAALPRLGEGIDRYLAGAAQ